MSYKIERAINLLYRKGQELRLAVAKQYRKKDPFDTSVNAPVQERKFLLDEARQIARERELVCKPVTTRGRTHFFFQSRQ